MENFSQTEKKYKGNKNDVISNLESLMLAEEELRSIFFKSSEKINNLHNSSLEKRKSKEAKREV